MKIHRSISWFVAIVALLIALVLWFGKKKSAEMPLAVSTTTNLVPLAVAAASPPASTPVHSSVPPVAQVVLTPQPMKTAQTMRKELAELNDEEVVLYARVIDQFGSPVADATVTGNVQVNNGTRVGADKISFVTDGNGFFTISGYKGKALGIWITKKGYVMATTNTYFIYSLLWPASRRFIPDQNNPTVIEMWKLQGAEPLVDISKEYKLPFTSAPIYFDLIAGKIVPSGGDLKITVNRPDGDISQQHPQNWSIQIEVINGGLIETSSEDSRITYAAPENDYQGTDTFGNNNGPNLADKMFFIQSRNGRVYSKVHLLFGINDTPDGLMDITFSGVANTNSSRNWEATAPH